ncbi:MAG: hypothetical protein M3131_04370 [Actinomycetota bacterium]|nr:hypothetical protein [Actinomycetota bacterium]
MRYVRRLLALCAICSLLLPVAAQGQRDATQPDPDSPAGVEYQLPLEQARKNARGSGSRGDGAGRGGGSPLFGAGIMPVKASGGAQDRGSGAGEPASDAGSRDSDARGAGGADGDPESATIGPSTLGGPDEGGGSAGLRIAGIALAVLLVGLLLGLLLRRGLSEQ